MKPESPHPPTSKCSKCMAETSLEDLFCQDCGQILRTAVQTGPDRSQSAAEQQDEGSADTESLDAQDSIADDLETAQAGKTPALWEASHIAEYEDHDANGYYSTLEPQAMPRRSWFSIDLRPS